MILTIAVLLFLGLCAADSDHCRIDRFGHYCVPGQGPRILNLQAECPRYYNINRAQECLVRAGTMPVTCYPCCMDEGKTIQQCSSLESGQEIAEFPFNPNSLQDLSEISPCNNKYDPQVCSQSGTRTSGATQIQPATFVHNENRCISKCKQTSGCEWFDFDKSKNKCYMYQNRGEGDLIFDRNFSTGSKLAFPITSPSCICSDNPGTRRDQTRPNWGATCPQGTRQFQIINGGGVLQCCPFEASPDGTPVCQY